MFSWGSNITVREFDNNPGSLHSAIHCVPTLIDQLDLREMNMQKENGLALLESLGLLWVYEQYRKEWRRK